MVSLCGQRLIPTLIDQLAQNDPYGTWMSVPVSSSLADGFMDISYSTLANAINRAARWIESRCGRSADFETLLYIGGNDARYFIFFAAAVRTGYKIFFPSPKNSLSGHLRLVEATDCEIMLYTSSSSDVRRILDHKPMRDRLVPELQELLAEDVVPAIPYEKSFVEARDEPCLVLHTSGTTGHPNPIILTHAALAIMDALWLIPPLDGRECFLKTMAANPRMYLAMPFFHMAGFSIGMTLSLCPRSVVVLGPGDRPVSVPLVEQVLEYANVTSAMLPPSILEEMSKSEAALESLGLLQSVYYGGASMSRAAGSAIARRTRLFNQIGSTESVVFITHDTDPEDFQYSCFNAQRNGLSFRATAERGIYELFIVRDPNIEIHQGPFKIFPHLQEYATRDLYSKHPTKPDHWLFQGRADDVIVFANGEKWNPCEAEAHIRRHPLVSMTLITGQNRLQPTAIIELSEPVSGPDCLKAQLIDNIWPLIVEANSVSPAHGQIAKSHVMLSNTRKPFQRTGKGSMKRSATTEIYATELDDLYAMAEHGQTSGKPGLDRIDPTNRSGLQEFIRSICTAMTGRKELASDADIFNAGADSLQAIVAVQKIKSRLSPTVLNLETVTPGVIYSNPTVDKLTSFLYRSTKNPCGASPSQEMPQAADMRTMLDKYSRRLPKRFRTHAASFNGPLVVILTGSTGSLGSYLLDALMKQDQVLRIYCLNRTADGMKRQTASNEARGLSVDWSRKDVRFLQADLSKMYLGLARRTWENMVSDVNSILHNQWQVDFNLILSSFEPHIQGVYNLIDFSAQTARDVPIFFVSSISTIQNWNRRSCKVAESFFPDLTLPVGGYGQSKAIASLLLEEASGTSGIGGAVVRVGQISGPVRSFYGVWNQQEWFPTLIFTSRLLRCLPGDLASMNTIDWVPVDIMAEILIELMLTYGSNTKPSQRGTGMRMFHAVNPNVCQWQDLLPTVREHIGKDFPVIPFEQWVQRLQDSAEAEEIDTDFNPGVKLIEFFQGMVRDKRSEKECLCLETMETEQCSETLRELEPVRRDWMRFWLEQWGFAR